MPTLPRKPFAGPIHWHVPADAADAMLDALEPRFLNYYECPCGATWTDAWSAQCDDDCPDCGTTCSPTRSDDVPAS